MLNNGKALKRGGTTIDTKVNIKVSWKCGTGVTRNKEAEPKHSLTNQRCSGRVPCVAHDLYHTCVLHITLCFNSKQQSRGDPKFSSLFQLALITCTR